MDQKSSALTEESEVSKERRVTLKELPPDLQPREKFEALGGDHLSSEDLLAIILRSGTPQKTAVQLAREILTNAGGLSGLATASLAELNTWQIKGFGRVKHIEVAAFLELARRIARILKENARSKADAILTAEDIYGQILQNALDLSQECFWLVSLDVRGKLLEPVREIARGMLDRIQINPREVFRPAVRNSAYAVAFAHNHPSGDPTPSRQDIQLTDRLIEGAHLLGIYVLDHVVIGKQSHEHPNAYVSLRDLKRCKFDFTK